MTAAAGTVNLTVEGAGLTALGGWGKYLSNGLSGSVQAKWLFSRKFQAGLGLEGVVFGDGYSEDASLLQLKPMGILSFYFRPRGRSFNPGIVAAFGYCRSRLSSGEGVDPVSWDPFWRAGVRWNFSLGEPWRAGIGFDLESVLSSEKNGDAFKFTFGVSREVSL